jgi:hypothetical protein
VRLILEAALLVVIASYAVAAEPCDSFRDAKGRSVVDFAPPAGLSTCVHVMRNSVLNSRRATLPAFRQSGISFEALSGSGTRRVS